MDGRVAAAVAVLVLTASAVAAVPVGGTPSEDPGGFGASISAFMQSSAAETEGSIENGMWSATFNRSDAERRDELVQRRSNALERKVDRLQAERYELLNGSDGGITPRERAKAARLASRIETLNAAINDTQRAAEVAGVNVTRLDDLRSKARTLNGSEVAEMARGLAGNNGTERGNGGLVDVPGLGDDGPPGRDEGNGSANDSDGEAPGKADRGNANAGNGSSGAGSGNSDRGRSGNAASRGNGSNAPTPTPENGTTTQNETAARESDRRGSERQGEKDERDRRRGNGNVTAGNTDDGESRSERGSSGNPGSSDGENASGSGDEGENRSGNVSSR